MSKEKNTRFFEEQIGFMLLILKKR